MSLVHNVISTQNMPEPSTRQVALTLNTLWNRQQDAGDKRFTVVRLLEDSDLLAKT